MAKHYRYGGSTAGRTIQCPAWIPLAQKMPISEDGNGNDFADLGTLKHNAMEALGTSDIEFEDLIGMTYNDQVLTEEMLVEDIKPAQFAYEEFADEHDLQLELYEQQVKIDEEIGGTADLIAVNSDTVFIMDWKFGYNLVSPVENPQGLFYALCALEDPRTAKLFEGRDKIVIGIMQPEYLNQGYDSMIQTWETDMAHLNAFADSYFDALENQDAEKPCAGDHCKYCPAMVICPVKTGQARAATMLDPKSEDVKVLAQALELADTVIEWANAVKKFAHEQAELGTKIDGYKLVAKRATRKWTDEEEVLDIVRKAKKLKLEEATTIKLLSPAQLEKVMKKKDLDFDKYASYIESVSTGTTLTTADDKRPEVFNSTALADALTLIND